MPVVTDLYHKGKRNLAIMTGRHGDRLGQKLGPDLKFLLWNPQDSADSAIDPASDEGSADFLRRQFRVNIEVMDVGNGSCHNTGWLKAAIGSQLEENKIVIPAWCYSLYAMKSGWSVLDPFLKQPEDTMAADRVPISRTAQDWIWALSYPTLPALTSILKVLIAYPVR